jgi:hypothetical protein
MTSTVNTATRALIESDVYELLAIRIDVVVTVLLLVLVIESEVIGAYLGSAGRRRLAPLRAFLVPLLMIFAVIVVARTTSLR